ncbi:4'-phosphopantetheinyl transferase family protein [Deinococcus sp.]|uniref:4'-phosphopantetheinyl transferase family protein n=1 Tax=Deinococcus sp. TaxID=47478 RepID=UPI003CC57469
MSKGEPSSSQVPRVVEVWTYQLASSPFSDPTGTLPVSEQQRADQLMQAGARRLFLAAAHLKRSVLAQSVGLPPADLRFQTGPNGKPFLAAGQNPHDLRFNLTHSGQLALLAVTRGAELGIDLERLRAVQWRGVAAQVFSQSERHTLRHTPPARQPQVFFDHWTAKEAYLKALGCGLSIPPESVSLHIRHPEVQVIHPAAHDQGVWQGRLFTPAEGYRAALVVEAGSGSFALRLLDWRPDRPISPSAPLQAAD